MAHAVTSIAKFQFVENIIELIILVAYLNNVKLEATQH